MEEEIIGRCALQRRPGAAQRLLQRAEEDALRGERSSKGGLRRKSVILGKGGEGRDERKGDWRRKRVFLGRGVAPRSWEVPAQG